MALTSSDTHTPLERVEYYTAQAEAALMAADRSTPDEARTTRATFDATTHEASRARSFAQLATAWAMIHTSDNDSAVNLNATLQSIAVTLGAPQAP